MGWLSDFGDSVVSWAGSAANSIGDFAVSAYDSVSSAIGSTATFVSDSAVAVGNGLVSVANTVGDGVKQVYSDTMGLLKSPFNALTDIAQSPLALFAVSGGVIAGAYLLTSF